MSSDDALREHILSNLRSATERRFEEALKDFPAGAMNLRPPNVDYTPWHLLEHLRISQWDILEYVRNPKYVSPQWPLGYWPAKDTLADAAAWSASLDQFRADRRDLEALVADKGSDLLLPIPHTQGHTLLREALLNAGHTSFHVGEFGVLRQVMLTWPPDHDR